MSFHKFNKYDTFGAVFNLNLFEQWRTDKKKSIQKELGQVRERTSLM